MATDNMHSPTGGWAHPSNDAWTGQRPAPPPPPHSAGGGWAASPPPAWSPHPPPPSHSNSGLSSGAIAAIVAGVLVLVAVPLVLFVSFGVFANHTAHKVEKVFNQVDKGFNRATNPTVSQFVNDTAAARQEAIAELNAALSCSDCGVFMQGGKLKGVAGLLRAQLERPDGLANASSEFRALVDQTTSAINQLEQTAGTASDCGFNNNLTRTERTACAGQRQAMLNAAQALKARLEDWNRFA